MPSGYQVNGNDLDSIFAPYHPGWPQAAATGYQVGSADLNGRYAPLSTGAPAGATNYQVRGIDLNAIFAAAGSTGVQVGTQPSNVSGSAAAGNPSGTVTSGAASCAGAKGSGVYTYQWTCTGCTATSPTGSSTTFSATVNAGTTIDPTAYCTISDGVTSVNTSTITIALTNTTAPSWTFTITAAQRVVSGNSWTGYETTLGSGTNLTAPDGHTLNMLVDTTQTDAIDGATFSVAGFAADPGQAYFVSITANGKTQDAAAATYSYSSGVATWVWNLTGSTADMFGFVSGDTYTVTVNY